jgi:DNA recombination protein RmuC
MTAAALIIGLIVGAFGVCLWARGEIRSREARLENADDARALAERTQAQWDEQLKALTHDALTSSQTRLLELAEAKLEPIKDTLARFDTQSQALEHRRLTAVSEIDRALKTMLEGQERLRKETGNLVTALRAPHVRGRWGEIQLRRVLELAGMISHCDFVEQTSERDGDGRLLRPDVVVKLPGGKSIVIDSKTPLDAYLDAAEAENDDLRREHLVRHARLVREHVTKLGQKRYWQQFEPSPDFVVMFLGDESFFRTAVDVDPSLFEAGVDEGVVLASPTTLIALLRTVAYGWQQETVAESAREIAGLGRDLYERLGVFGKHLTKVGRSLDSAVGAYNEAVGSFETRVLVTARKFPEHGAGGDEPIETKPVERAARPLFAPELDEADDVAPLVRRVDAA